jgi:hypothetical protein
MIQNFISSPVSRRVTGKTLRMVILTGIFLVSAFVLDALDAPGNAIISRINIEIDGDKTSEIALRQFLDISEGQDFPTEADMNIRLLMQEQDLINERIFESVSVVYKVIPDMVGNYIVTVYVKDSWTFIPIPFVSYNSNTGLKIGVKTTYDNALGSMTNWSLDTDITLGPDYYSIYSVKGFTINPQLTGLKVGSLRYSGEFNQQYKTEETGDPGNWTEYKSFHQTFIAFGTSWEFSDDWYYSLFPALGFKYSYIWEIQDPDSVEDRYNIVWNHSIGLSRVDHVRNNFRQGDDTRLGNNLKALGTSLPDAFDTHFRFVADVSFDSRIYYLLGEIFNFYHRLYTYYVYNDIYRGSGEYIRGVRDSTMTGSSGVFQQNSFGIDVVHVKGAFNLQIHPFFDYGYTWGGTAGTTAEFRYGFGADFLLFVDKAENLTLCTTVGFDPSRNFSEEIIIRTGFSY